MRQWLFMVKRRASSEESTEVSSRARTAAKTKSPPPHRVKPKPPGLAKVNKELLREVLGRKQIEAKLRESEERERAILDSIPDLAWLKDRRGRYLAVNEAWCRFFGVRSDDVVGKTAYDVLPQDFARRVSKDDRKVIRSGKPLSYEEVIPSKSGRMIWRETVKTPLRNNQGVIVGIVGITHDITARKKAQDALKASELAARALQERLTTLHDVVLELSRAGSFDELCRRAVQLGMRRLGFDRLGLWFTRPNGEIQGSFGTDESGRLRDERGVQIHAPPVGEFGRLLARQTRLAVMDEAPLTNHRGHAVGQGARLVSALWDGDRVIGILGADNLIHHRPITQADRQLLMLYAAALGHLCSRQRAEESLRQSEETYRQVFTTETDALALVDAQTRQFVDVNESACRLYGYSREEFLRLKQLDCSADREASNQSLAELRRKKNVFVPLRYHKKKDGTEFPVEVSANTFYLRGKRMICAAIRDITARKRSQEAVTWLASFPKLNPQPITEVDLSGRFYFLNPAARKAMPDLAQRRLGHPWLSDWQAVIQAFRKGKTQSQIREISIGEACYRQLIHFIPKLQRIRIYGMNVTDRRRAQEALRVSRSKLAIAREEERRRLSRELHDSLAQKLVAMSIRLKTFGEQTSASLSDWQVASLGELSKQLQDVFSDVRHVSRTLYPPTLEPLGLCAALKQLASDLQSEHTLVHVRCGRSAAEARFQLEMEIELFRIAQEAASNALRHGRIRRLDLSLRYAKGFLRLTVTDDGKGFDTEKTFPKGLGLISMRERAQEIGGTLRITSRPGQTRVEVRVRAQKRS